MSMPVPPAAPEPMSVDLHPALDYYQACADMMRAAGMLAIEFSGDPATFVLSRDELNAFDITTRTELVKRHGVSLEAMLKGVIDAKKRRRVAEPESAIDMQTSPKKQRRRGTAETMGEKNLNANRRGAAKAAREDGRSHAAESAVGMPGTGIPIHTRTRR